jgi:hypothetical protein
MMPVVAYALNGTVTAKLALKILDLGVVAEAGDKERSQRVANNVGVFMRLDCEVRVSVV